VEASSAAEGEACDVVEALGPAVVDAQPDRGDQAVAELADGLGRLDECVQPGAVGPTDPPVDQLGDGVRVQVAGEDRPERFLSLNRPSA
jgi:hypothetical protein